MNTANKVTILRMLLIPIFLVVMMIDFAGKDIWAAVIFAVASFTDGVDGYIARKYNQVTDFGKFLDPLADKLLVSTALICLVGLGRIAAYMAVIIIAREFIVTGLRSVAAAKGVVIAASMTGKIKTCIQIAASLCAILFWGDKFMLFGYSLGYIAMFISTLYTIYSGWDYLYKNRELILSDR